ncbi:Lrp/AsnC family transcriptional regulator [Candidatus Woesearchaeota archaeon]|nr:Lrp/AsnC family transcriptional regulator [Candidatus Woesearchaeota archaeon]
MKIDAKDHKIISILRENSRMSIRDIAKKANLRPSTVHQRIQRLKRNNVIEKYTLKLNDQAMGQDFIVFMLVAGKPTEYLNDMFLKHKNVKEVFGVTGEHDLLFKLKFKDVHEFNDFVMKFRKLYKEITKTLTMVVTVNLKEEL